MWIVRLALSRPYTFIVMALVVILLTPVVLLRTPTDIFPEINIPVISLVWSYNGLSPQDMEQRITSNSERAVTTLVNDVEHIESQSLNGIAVVKIYFQPSANIQTALAQTKSLPALRTSRNFQAHFSLQSRHKQFSAQHCLPRLDPHFMNQIVAFD